MLNTSKAAPDPLQSSPRIQATDGCTDRCCRHEIEAAPKRRTHARAHMRRLLVTLAMAALAASCATPPGGDAAVRATATSTHATNGRVIVFRFVKEFRAGFRKESLPDRIILVWRYESGTGLPATAEREAMDRLEDLLAPAVEKAGVSMLTLVSTGENLREWIYYAKSEEEFLQALNDALVKQPRFPIEIHAAPDPKWSTYERFREGLRE